MTRPSQLPLSRLRDHIGQHLEVGGRDCQIIDILEDGPQIVMQVCGTRSIQPDQWGDAHRRTPESFSIPVYEADGFTFNPVIRDLLI